MIIKSISFIENNTKSFDILNPHMNLITSNSVNSVGKSTLSRLIFYGLGYPIPSTEDIDFKKIYCETIISQNGVDYSVNREGTKLTIEKIDKTFKKEYLLPDDHNSFLMFLFSVDKENIARNMLGLMYIDQEKGWTLLNRGKVIGSIRFSIDELVASLNNVDCDELFYRRDLYEDEKDKYSALLSIDTIKEEYYNETGNLSLLSDYEYLKREMAALQISINDKKKEIKEVEEVINNDEKLFQFFADMSICINVNGEPIKINKDNIVCSYNLDYLKARKAILESDLYILKKQLSNLKEDYQKATSVPDLFSNNKSVDNEMKINRALSMVDIDVEQILSAKDEVKKTISEINISIKERTKHNNPYIRKIYDHLNEYANILGIENYISNNIDYIFTNNLKSKTGANFQKLIIAFKVAIIKVLEEELGICAPLLIDSPKSKELDDKNTELIMNFIKDKLENHQIIVASIYNQEKLFVRFENTIAIKQFAIEER